MGTVTKLLLIIWLVISTLVSLVLVIKVNIGIGLRTLVLREQTCLEIVVRWHLWVMAFICITSLVGLFACICQIKILSSIFNLLLDLLLVFLLVLLLRRFFLFGFRSKAIKPSFESICQGSSTLEQEYKPVLRSSAGSNAWPNVQKCLNKIQFCEEVPGPERLFGNNTWRIEDFYDFYKEGCCTRPQRCAHHISTYKIETDECQKWVNATKSANAKCYECDSCKAARIATYQTKEMEAGKYNKFFFIYLALSSFLIFFGALD